MRWIALLFGLLLSCAARAQVGQVGAFVSVSSAPTCTGGYQGPADVVASPASFAGLQAVSCAYAAPGTNPSLTVVRATSGSQTINILSNGQFDIATANTFGGTDATASCTAASTTLTCTGASSTPHAQDPISGSGITQPVPTGAFITACGTFVGGAGTCTLNAAQTVSVAVTVTFAVVLTVSAAADQSGHGQNLTQATGANQPQLFPNCGNSLPCVSGLGNQWLQGGTTTVAFPWTILLVSESTSTNTWTVGTVVAWALGSNSGANDFALFSSGSFGHVTAVTGLVHVFQVVNSSANTIMTVDAAQNGVGDGNPSTSLATPYALGALASGSNAFTGTWTSFGTWTGAFSGTQMTNMCHLLHTNQATPTTC
jgi:hypothetical protein